MFKGKKGKVLLIVAIGGAVLFLLRRKPGQSLGQALGLEQLFNASKSSIAAADKAVSAAGKLNVAVNTGVVDPLTGQPNALIDLYRNNPTQTPSQRTAARAAADANPAAAAAAKGAVQDDATRTFLNLKTVFSGAGSFGKSGRTFSNN